MLRSRLTRFSVFALIVFILVAIDQITKRLAVVRLSPGGSFPVIENILEFVYSENRGAAFGILQGRQIFFYIISAVVAAVLLYAVYRLPKDKRFNPIFLVMAVIFSGMLGNLIDRVSNGYVVDFIYFVPINFPVFNIADIYVTTATAALFLLMLFFYGEEELNFMGWRI